ncbi:MAG: phage tail protein [Bacteroidota bacterium]
MMKNILLFFLSALLINFVNAQNENKGFSFQGYARDFEGAALSKQTITVKFSIYPEGQSNEYEEEQTVDTDAYGVFHAVVGSEKPNDFGKINFGRYKYWLKVEVKAFGSSYVEISNTELLSVPYAKASETASNGVPAGTILPFAGDKSKIPAGYLPCDGSLVSKTVYPDLYNAIGSAWGESGGDFYVPDLRGQFLRGVADGQNSDPDRDARFAKNGGNDGDRVGSFQNDEIEKHNHDEGSLVTSTSGAHKHDIRAQNGGDVSDRNDNDWIVENNGDSDNRNIDDRIRSAGDHTHDITGNTGDRGGDETRPKNAYVWYMIKY